MSDNATSEVVKVDLDEAVKKLAIQDGVTDASELAKVVGVKRYDQYAAQVRSYYAGYDQGYAAGIAMMGRPLRKYVLQVVVLAFLAGALVGSLIMAYLYS
ncbi:MAG: hypothetical protein BWY85_00182 [Firmicutes bacterium ADurb.Bin506]|nr:MAG: hypothetical protein BWY85_00182 [Firmicutes bacterium ADurb.Bin506]